MRRFLGVGLILAFAATGPFWPYFAKGLSFYTFHALSGLMAIKHQVARAMAGGEYPLWDPALMNGVPVHSGIGVLDPLLISHLFFDGIQALLFSAYLALFCAGLFMYFYLRQSYQLSIPAALLGGILYLTNPFFAATSHELPFMAPAIYLPLVFLFYEQGVERSSFARAFVSGLFLGGAFFSGNLESFYFVLLFFLTVQFSRLALQRIHQKSWKSLKAELPFLVAAVSFSFLCTAIDLWPTLELVFDSARSEDGRILQNGIHFTVVGIAAVIISWGLSRFKSVFAKGSFDGSKFSFLVLFVLFAFNLDSEKGHLFFQSNLFYPSTESLMFDGMDAYHFLRQKFRVAEEILKPFFEPRFIFYIQPPSYLFNLCSLILFAGLVVYTSQWVIRLLGIIAILLVIYPHTIIPDLSVRILGLSALNYARYMFAFFFIQAVLAAYAFERLKPNSKIFRRFKGLKGWLKAGVLTGGLWIAVLILLALRPFAFDLLLKDLRLFAEGIGGGDLAARTLLYARAVTSASAFFFRENMLFFGFAIVKGAALIVFCFCLQRSKPFWRYFFVFLMALEGILPWSLYVFQKLDIRYLKPSYAEIDFLEKLPPDARVGTLYNPRITLDNFYDEERRFNLSLNLPVFWDVMTVEQSALNLKPKLHKQFWFLEKENTSYQPTYLETAASPVYDLMGMNYLFSEIAVDDTSLRFLQEGSRYKIYENQNALPRVYFSKQVQKLSDEEIAGHIEVGDWNFHELTYVEAEVPEKWAVSVKPVGEKWVKVIRRRQNELMMRSESPSAEFLATTEAYHRNWKVFVDGQPEPVVKTNYFFRGVFLEPGVHEIRFVYAPWTFQAGAWLTILSFGALAVFWGHERVKKRLRNPLTPVRKTA